MKALSRREMDEIDIRIVEMTTRESLAAPPGERYRNLLEDCICGVGEYPKRNLTHWTAHIWGQEYEHGNLPRNFLQQEVDMLMTDCSLARLAYFIHQNDDNLLMAQLKKAWTRVLLADVSSMFALWPGQTCSVTYTQEAFDYIRLHDDQRRGRTPEAQVGNLLLKMNR